MTDFKLTNGVKVAAIVLGIFLISAICAPLIAPFDPYDASQVSLWDGKLPPFWMLETPSPYLLGTDPQGRDLVSAILYGTRTSILIAALAVCIGSLFGCALGLIAGFFGGRIDAIVSRLADIQLTFPAILLAMLFNGLIRAALPQQEREDFAFWVVVVAIAMTDWPQFMRAVRGSTMMEKNKNYIAAARLLGLSNRSILVRHIMPNVSRPIIVVATVAFALAIIAETTLSFLGQGMPATTPSLGMLIRTGNDFLYAGYWWITLFPVLTLIGIVLCTHVIGDWMRDFLDYRHR